MLYTPLTCVSVNESNRPSRYWTGTTTLVTRVGKKSIYTHFAPPHPCTMLKKHFHLTQVRILSFSNIERGNGGFDTYSAGIMIVISCFWHFATQFVQGCSLQFDIFFFTVFKILPCYEVFIGNFVLRESS